MNACVIYFMRDKATYRRVNDREPWLTCCVCKIIIYYIIMIIKVPQDMSKVLLLTLHSHVLRKLSPKNISQLAMTSPDKLQTVHLEGQWAV